MNESGTIAGFELGEILGEGGMGTVYKAHQLSLDRIVAVKILKPHLVENAEDVARFQLEAKAAAKLNHPGIVHVYDAGAEGGKYYFVMEYVEGQQVGDWLEREGKIPESDALTVAACVAEALAHGWEKAKIIHRDIKPDNILIDKDGVVKVADLGLVKLGGRDDTDEEHSEIGALTPNYCSPEQAAFLDQIDFRADIYSLGATLYHMLTGQLPFVGQDPHEILRQQVVGSLPDPRDVVPGISDGTAILLRRMMAKKPGERFASWEQVGVDIGTVASGRHPAEPLPETSLSTVAYKPSKPQAVKTSGTGKKVLSKKSVPAGAKRVVLNKQEMAEVSAQAAAMRKKKKPTGTVVGVLLVLALAAGAYVYLEKFPPVETTTAPAADTLSVKLDEAKSFVEQNPEDYDAAIARYREIAELAAGTEYEASVTSVLGTLTQLRQQDIDGTMADLEAQAEQLMAERKFNQAKQLVQHYDGLYASETDEARQFIMENIQSAIKKIEQVSKFNRREAERKKKLQAAQALVSPGLAAIVNWYDTAWIDLRKKHQEKLDLAGQRYRAMLEKVEGRARTTGQLDHVLAVKKEIERFDREKSLPGKVIGSPPPLLKEAMTRGALVKLEAVAALKAQKPKLIRQALEKLGAEQKKLVSEERIEQAVKVREVTQHVKAKGSFPPLIPKHLSTPLERSSAPPRDEVEAL